MTTDQDARTRFGFPSGQPVDLLKIDANANGGFDGKAAVAKRLQEYLDRLRELQTLLFTERQRAVLVCLQGMDGAGKDGVINHVFNAINPMGCQVTAFKQPSELERAHDFLWRHHLAVPQKGMVGLFNRSHYEAVVVERVDKIADTPTVEHRYADINNFEKMLSNSGTTVIKFFLHISKGEQLARFKSRLDDPMKHWKITTADFDQRQKWDDNISAYADAIQETNTPHAPWYVIPSNRKWYRDLSIAEVMVETLAALKLKIPPPPSDLDQLQDRYKAELKTDKKQTVKP